MAVRLLMCLRWLRSFGSSRVRAGQSLSALFPEHGSPRDSERVIGQCNRGIQQFLRSFCAAFRKGRGGEEEMGFADHVAERLEILAVRNLTLPP
jgi:hypothetical protein